MDPTFFRPAATDFDALTALWEASVRATHHFLDEAYIRYLKPLIRNEYLKSVELYGLRGNDGAIVAFMGYPNVKSKCCSSIPPSGRWAWVGIW